MKRVVVEDSQGIGRVVILFGIYQLYCPIEGAFVPFSKDETIKDPTRPPTVGLSTPAKVKKKLDIWEKKSRGS